MLPASYISHSFFNLSHYIMKEELEVYTYTKITELHSWFSSSLWSNTYYTSLLTGEVTCGIYVYFLCYNNITSLHLLSIKHRLRSFTPIFTPPTEIGIISKMTQIDNWWNEDCGQGLNDYVCLQMLSHALCWLLGRWMLKFKEVFQSN